MRWGDLREWYDQFAHAVHSKLRHPIAVRWLEWWASDEHKELVIVCRSRYEWMFWEMAYREQGWPV